MIRVIVSTQGAKCNTEAQRETLKRWIKSKEGFEGIHSLGVKEESNDIAKDKESAEGDLNKRKGSVLDEYQVDNQGFC